jgi:hypothetical protein
VVDGDAEVGRQPGDQVVVGAPVLAQQGAGADLHVPGHLEMAAALEVVVEQVLLPHPAWPDRDQQVAGAVGGEEPPVAVDAFGDGGLVGGRSGHGHPGGTGSGRRHI